MAKNRDYEVGYGKPPEATRFKPGRSGNTKGRPKKVAGDVCAEALFLKLAARPITVTIDGKKQAIS